MFFKFTLYSTLTLLTSAIPFLYDAPRTLTSLVSSASAASSASQPLGNIADLRGNKAEKLKNLEDDADDEEFFRQSVDETSEETNEAAPGLLQKKIGKILRKIQFLSSLAGGGGSNTDTNTQDDDDFRKEQDDFNKEFDEDTKNSTGTSSSANLEEGSGYFYEAPSVRKSEKQREGVDKIGFNPAAVGVFFMELIGSLVGLAYGAAAQFNQGGGATQ